MIYFIRRKYDKQPVNASFFLMDGDQHANLERLNIGDDLDIFWKTSRQVSEAIDDIRQMTNTVETWLEPFDHEKANVIIHCKVIKKIHVVSPDEVGHLRLTSESVYLQAIDGFNEDILEWWLFGTLPPWVHKEDLEGQR